jgi:hypothetical protein
MPAFSSEAIIAIVTLVATRLPLCLLLWRRVRRQQRSQEVRPGKLRGFTHHYLSVTVAD